MSNESNGLGILLGIKPRRAESRSRLDPRLAAVKRLRAALKGDEDDTVVLQALSEWDKVKDLGPGDD
jgi:hypothetical protein